MAAPLWRLVDVTVPGRGRPRLEHVTVEIPAGVTAIVGPSGAGKTTLLNLLVGFERPRSGTVEYHPAPVLAPGESPGGMAVATTKTPGDSPGAKTKMTRLPVFWVPPGHGLWPHLTVRQHLASIVPDAAAEIDSLMHEFDLDHLSRDYPATLSQGERDRVSLARAIASGAETLILDEPLAHVPNEAAGRYWSQLRSIHRQHKMNLVMATHDLDVAQREADHVIVLDAGRAIASGGAADVFGPASQEST